MGRYGPALGGDRWTKGEVSVMRWTTEDLEAALRKWEQRLAQDGKRPLTITTYVRDARAFLAYLNGVTQRRRSTSNHRASSRSNARSPQRNESTQAFDELGRLSRQWIRSGSARQRGIAWPRDRWTTAFPEHATLLASLPDRLDREGVRNVAKRAGDGPRQAVEALVVSRVWGFGRVGYGPHRTRRILAETPGAAELLHVVALTLAADGPVAAYGRLGRDCRVKWFGPAFGTKYLAFSQQVDQPIVALIHDELVSSWLVRNGRPDLASHGWSERKYEAYVVQVHAWARQLDCSAETLEYLMFQAIADERGNQWSE
jgi:hypothetical protein